MTASSEPTSTVSSSPTLMLFSTPPAGEGISVSTLSVETSSNGSSASTRSPSCFNQRGTVPSETLSPRRGNVTETAMESCLGAVHVQGLAVQCEVRLAHRLRKRRVRVDQLRDLDRQRLPVGDQLRFRDEVTCPRSDHVHAEDRPVLGRHN